MTTVTKIFVILVCLFAFVFTPMAIVFAGRTYDWQRLAEQYKGSAEVHMAKAMSAQAVAASQQEYFNSLLARRDDEANQLRARIEEGLLQIDNLTQDRDQLRRSRDSLESSTSLLSGQLQVKEEVNKTLAETREQALANERDLQLRNTELVQKNMQLQAELVIVKQKLHEQEEVAHNFRTENAQLRQQINLGPGLPPLTSTPTPGAMAVSAVAAAPIHGTVTAVDLNANMASLDVGSASGVKEGMVMVAVRDGQYICDLTITSHVTPTEAVGQIKLEGDRRIRVGDDIIDLNSFNAQY
ncbi:MAG: hypothetical protein GXY44_00015 [Phycisphaerales bacterium]|nr:hypothetical protein [Phycisphaerales bacterium]